MPHSKENPLETKQEAIDVWQKLPKGTPSRAALPPASDGLGNFWRYLLGGLIPLREHKAAFLLGLAACVVIVVGVVLAWR